jgi:hypothetical protein
MAYMRDANGVRLDAHPLAYPIVEAAGAYPARPTGLPASFARYVGKDAPTTALAGDTWMPVPRNPKPILYSEDFYSDVSLEQLRVLAYYASIGWVNPLAVVIDTANVPNITASAVDAMLRSEGLVLPIGQVSTTYSDLTSAFGWQRSTARNLPHADWSGGVPDAAVVMRQALAPFVGGTDKVTIVCTGYQSAMQALRASAADGISSLTGDQLIAATVGEVVIMGGDYPGPGNENNFNRSAKTIAAAVAVVNNWSTTFPTIPLTFTGYTFGGTVMIGTNLYNTAPATDPIRQELIDLGYATTGRAAWDAITMYYACITDGTDASAAAAGFGVVHGTNNVNASNGINTFTAAGNGPQRYLTKSNADATYAATLDALITPGQQPAPPPSGTQVWTGSRWVPAAPKDAAPRLRQAIPLPAASGDLTASLLGRWRANSITSVADGAAVASWPNFIGGGAALAQATGAKQPLYVAADATDGFPAVQFSGAQWMETASNITPPPSGAMTVYAKVRWATLPSSNQTVVAMDTASGSNRNWHLKGITGGAAQAAQFTAGSAITQTSPPGLVANKYHILVLRMDPIYGIDCLLDGRRTTGSGGGTAVRAALSAAAIPLHVGCATTATPAEPLTGFVRDVAVYSGFHTDTQVAAISATM